MRVYERRVCFVRNSARALSVGHAIHVHITRHACTCALLLRAKSPFRPSCSRSVEPRAIVRAGDSLYITVLRYPIIVLCCKRARWFVKDFTLLHLFALFAYPSGAPSLPRCFVSVSLSPAALPPGAPPAPAVRALPGLQPHHGGGPANTPCQHANMPGRVKHNKQCVYVLRISDRIVALLAS